MKSLRTCLLFVISLFAPSAFAQTCDVVAFDNTVVFWCANQTEMNNTAGWETQDSFAIREDQNFAFYTYNFDLDKWELVNDPPMLGEKVLTEGQATAVVRLPVGVGTGAGGKLCYVVFSADATDQQTRSACVSISVSNKAGVETCGMVALAGTNDASIIETEDGSGSGAISSGTLGYAITCDTTPTNAVDIRFNASSSLTQTTLRATYKIDWIGTSRPIAQD